MKSTIYFLLVFSIFNPVIVCAKLKVLTTTTTLKSIVESVGKQYVDVDSVTKGPQDPHFVEAKPSYMVKARQADLIVAVGLDLEIGWLPNITRGSRNPRVMKGNSGYLEVGSLIEPIEVLSGGVDRSQGDIHALGNPHFTLDPVRVIKIASGIAVRLSQLDPDNGIHYHKNSEDFAKRINQRLLQWAERIRKSGVKQIVTYHKTLSYFLHRFDIGLSGSIEPKPGIPPTAKHILSLIELIRSKKISCILIESFFETNAAEKIKQSIAVNIEVVATEVLATKGVSDYEALIEHLVTSIERCRSHGAAP